MNTVIEINEDLVRRAELLAAHRGVTLREIVEQGLEFVLREEHCPSEFSLRDASVQGNGLQAEFREAGWARVRDAVYKRG